MKEVRVNLFWLSWRNLRPVLGKLASATVDNKIEIIYINQCSYQALRYSTVYINEKCQAAIIFTNLGI